MLATYFALRARVRPGAPFVFNTGLNLLGLRAGSQSGSRTLAEVVAKVAAAEFGYVRPPRPAEEQYVGPRSVQSLTAALAEAGWTVQRDWTIETPSTPESQRDWLRVPMFNQHQLRGLTDDVRLQILERAWRRWDKDCTGQEEGFYCLSAVAA